MSQLICSSLERFLGEVKISFLILNNFLHKNFLLLTELLFDFPLIVVNWSWAANIRIMCLINHLIICFFFSFLHYSGRVAGGNLIICFRRWIKIYSLSLIFKILSGRIVKHNCKNCKKKIIYVLDVPRVNFTNILHNFITFLLQSLATWQSCWNWTKTRL